MLFSCTDGPSQRIAITDYIIHNRALIVNLPAMSRNATALVNGKLPDRGADNTANPLESFFGPMPMPYALRAADQYPNEVRAAPPTALRAAPIS